MKKLFSIIGLIGLATPLLAAKISDSQLELGKESSTDNKEILFNIGEGTGNPKIRANYGTKKLEFTNDGTNFSELGSGGESGAYNIIDNAGFESDLTNWTNTGSGSLSVDTDAADVYQGQKSALWDAAAASDILASEAVTIPGGLRGNLCSVEVQYKGGDDNLKLQAYDGTNVLAEVTLEASGNFSKAMVTLTCPSSGTLQGRLIASADAAAVNVDNWVVGKSNDIIDVISDSGWIEFTPTISGATIGGTVVNNWFYRIIGNSLEIKINLVQTSAGTATGDFELTLPDGILIDTEAQSAGGSGGSVHFTEGYLHVCNTGTCANQAEYRPLVRDNQTLIFRINTSTFGNTTTANFSNTDLRVGGYISVPIDPASVSLNYNPVQRVETSAWHVNASLVGGDSTWDITSVNSTSNLPSRADGELIENLGSIPAQIMCNGAAPTGTTCSGVDELPGIAFDAPRAGPAWICTRGILDMIEDAGTSDFAQRLNLYRVPTDGSVSAGLLGTSWTSLQDIQLQEWRVELEAGLFTAGQDYQVPYYLCGITNLVAGKNGFVVAERTRLFSGAPTDINMSAVRWNVFPIEQQLPQALLISPEPAGEVASFAMNTCPAGWLKADGSAVNRTANSRLFDAIGTTFGVGDGSTTFNLPDMRGEFVRGFDDGRGVDSGRVFGSAQADELDSHSHVLRAREWSGSGSTDFGGTLDFRPRAATGGVDLSGINGTGVSSQDTSTTATGGSETRPRNVALLYCIRK